MPTHMRVAFSCSALALVLATSANSLAAPAAPKGAHPRLFLGSGTLATLKSQSGTPGTAAARAIAMCKDVAAKPADYKSSGYMGDNWAFPLSACALAYQLTGAAEHATTGIKLWRAILEDVSTMGDKGACVAGADETKAIASIKRDSTYAIRFIGPHAALAYDWLHDAPGVDDALRSQSRNCFKHWTSYYTRAGYLNTVSGSNYNAGYVVTKALVAVAEGSEDGVSSDKIWTETVDDVFGKQLVGDGLSPTGGLTGGDWPEGWQYGPLSVVHYALAARALQEQGVALPAFDQWSSDLALRFAYGLVPARDGMWVGGDTDDDTLYVALNRRILTASLIGGPSAQAANWAAFLRGLDKNKDTSPVFDALAEARTTTPTDPATAGLPLWYLAKGTRNVYARSAWDASAYFAVFTSSPRVVPDHQHRDAGNFVLSRGADHLVVDPSPYGSRSTLTGNGIAVDSPQCLPEYRPSQTDWSEAQLTWARGTKGGVVAARGDFAKAWIFSDKPSDVPFARRDWVFTPEGEVVTIDRTRTGDAGRLTWMRYRTPAKLTLDGKLATGTVGGSKLAIHQVKLSGGTAQIKSYPAKGNCDSGPHGSCTASRIAVDEYSIQLPGPKATAVHAIDALAAADSPATVYSMNDAPIDAASQNAGVIGAAVLRGKSMTYVVASSADDGVAGATLTYGTPGEGSARHVVFDAPEDASGKSNVSVAASGGRCVVTITAGGAFTGHPLMFSVTSAADGCKATDDPDAPPGAVPPGGGNPGSDAGTTPGGPTTPGADTGSSDSGGCGCMTPRHPKSPALALLLGLLLLPLRITSRRRAPRQEPPR